MAKDVQSMSTAEVAEMLMNEETPKEEQSSTQNQEQKLDEDFSIEKIEEALKKTTEEMEKEIKQEAEQREESQTSEEHNDSNARETVNESNLDFDGFEEETEQQENRDSQEREEREEEEEVLFADTKEERKRAKEAENQRKKEERQQSRNESKNKFLSGLNWIKDKVGKFIVGLAGVFGKIAGTIAGWILLGGKSHASETFADELVKKWSAEENAKQNAEMEKNRKEQEKSGQNRDNQEQNKDKQPPTKERENPIPKPQQQNTQEIHQESEETKLMSEEEQQREVSNPEQNNGNNGNTEHNDIGEENVDRNGNGEEQSSDEQNNEQHENPNQENVNEEQSEKINGNEQNGSIGQQEEQETQDENNNNIEEPTGKESKENDKVETKIDKMSLGELSAIFNSEESKKALERITESFNIKEDFLTGKRTKTGLDLSIELENDAVMFKRNGQGYGVPIQEFLKGDIHSLVNVLEVMEISMNQFSKDDKKQSPKNDRNQSSNSDDRAKYLLTAAFINGTIRKVNLEANNYLGKDVRNDEPLVYCNFNDGRKDFHFTIKRDTNEGFIAQIGKQTINGKLVDQQMPFNDKHLKGLLKATEIAVAKYEKKWNNLTTGIDNVTNCNEFIYTHSTATAEQAATATVDQQVQQNNKENYTSDQEHIAEQKQVEADIEEQAQMAKEAGEQLSEVFTKNDFADVVQGVKEDESITKDKISSIGQDISNQKLKEEHQGIYNYENAEKQEDQSQEYNDGEGQENQNQTQNEEEIERD